MKNLNSAAIDQDFLGCAGEEVSYAKTNAKAKAIAKVVDYRASIKYSFCGLAMPFAPILEHNMLSKGLLLSLTVLFFLLGLGLYVIVTWSLRLGG